jgi:8-oxo-dGTP pyrophosphatase MutT (NUDIX family)
MDEIVLHKVAAFVTRVRNDQVEILVFQHPYAEGVQFPAGTVEDGEAFEVAGLREAQEETGLKNLKMIAHLGTMDESLPANMVVMARTTRVYARPDVTSFDWAQLRNGIWVERLREQNGFTHVDWCEYDQHPHGTYITYRITGWVPNHTVTKKQQRHFYHLTVEGDTEETWTVFIDNHHYRLFWLPIESLEGMNFYQKVWWDWVKSRGAFR